MAHVRCVRLGLCVRLIWYVVVVGVVVVVVVRIV